VGFGCMESHPGEHYCQIFQEMLLWTDPKMAFYGRTMVKIKMIVTG
jgi:hypothetical protein